MSLTQTTRSSLFARVATALAAPFLALALSSHSAAAQGTPCAIPDQLDSAPCCTPVMPDLPNIPPGDMQGTGLCWDACGLVDQTCVRVSWDPINFTQQCGHFETKLRISDCAGTLLMSGLLVLDYTRTWNESTVAGAVDTQVWRYVAKVDLQGDYFTTPVCPVPPDLGPYPTTFFYGYFDFTRNCVTGSQDNALVLFHNCDAFIHDQSISSRPGTWHPSETFAIVAPDTAANPFVPVSTPLAPGLVVGEGMRSVAPSPVFGACLAEEQVFSGALAPLGSGCLCPLSLGSAMNTASILSGTGACGGSFTSLNFWPVAPWIDFTTTSLGTWTTTASYPGPERAHVGEGMFLYRDACDPTGITTNYLDIFYGGVTEGGFPVFSTSPVGGLTDRFIDLASNYALQLPGTVTAPLVGNVRPTDHLIYVNI